MLSRYQKSNTLIVSLDTEKVFDKVNCKFLFAIFEKFGFRESFLNRIRAFYTLVDSL